MENKADKSYHLKRVVVFVYISGLKDRYCESVGCNTGHNVGFNLNFELKNCHQSGQKTTCIIHVQDNKTKIDSIPFLFVKIL